MFDNIDNVTVKRVYRGTHQCVEITIKSKSKLSFTFLYDSWLNGHRKDLCNVFYADYPIYEYSGNVIKLSKIVKNLLYKEIGLPILSYKALGEAASKLIQLTSQLREVSYILIFLI